MAQVMIPTYGQIFFLQTIQQKNESEFTEMPGQIVTYKGIVEGQMRFSKKDGFQILWERDQYPSRSEVISPTTSTHETLIPIEQYLAELDETIEELLLIKESNDNMKREMDELCQ